MSGKVLEIRDILNRNSLAEDISYMYERYNQLRLPKLSEWEELRDYLFATDTTKTSNAVLPWKNKTTLPKITQIRDNLHANYMAALFPNDDWLRWEGSSWEDEAIEKRRAIEAYMKNKLRMGGFEKVVSQLLYDYIDYGNAIADCEYVREVHEVDGDQIPGFIGPRAVRVSPLDIVFNPVAARFEDSPKITRYLKTMGELKVEIETHPELHYNKEILGYAEEVRGRLSTYSETYIQKAAGFQVDGFGSLQDYFQSGYVEILEFEGDIHDEDGNLMRNALITVIDRLYVVRKETNPSWFGKSSKVHAGWRLRPDNLYGMGPLDNLVGMQYRIDHLENIKADLFDLLVMPPLKIKGNVEEFEFGPMSEIFLGEDGDVDVLKIDATGLQADTQIAILQQTMEEMAGAPKQAMGIRTPGEKTAFEVQTLENAASRIFQEKLRNFEIFILEPLLNNMLELAKRNMDGNDIIRTLDNDIGVPAFMNVTREDITASGKLRPMGAKHFAARNQMIQTMSQISNSRIFDMIMPHISGKRLAEVIEDTLQLDRYGLFQPNAQIMEQMETQRLAMEAQQQLEMEQMTPIEEEEEVAVEGQQATPF